MRLRDHLSALALTGFIALALVATGFGHRAPGLSDLRIEAFALATGTAAAADLCTDRDGDGVVDHGRCPACQIAASFLPPVPPVAGALVAAHPLRLQMPAPVIPARAHPRDPAHGLRAPPALI